MSDLHFETLRMIAGRFPEGSLEYESILIASKALLFASGRSDFEAYCKDFDNPLTSTQVEHLKTMGIRTEKGQIKGDITDVRDDNQGK